MGGWFTTHCSSFDWRRGNPNRPNEDKKNRLPGFFLYIVIIIVLLKRFICNVLNIIVLVTTFESLKCKIIS